MFLGSFLVATIDFSFLPLVACLILTVSGIRNCSDKIFSIKNPVINSYNENGNMEIGIFS